jgi:hypothetical protein
MRIRVVFLVVVLTLLVPALYAQHPDFSGTWVLNKAKSDYQMGRGGGTPDITMKVKQTGDTIKVNEEFSSEMGSRDRAYTLKTDGQEQQIQGFRGRPATATAQWDGSKLVISTMMSFERQGQKMEMASDDTWSLSQDGKVLTIDSTMESSFGTRTSKRVFDRSE